MKKLFIITILLIISQAKQKSPCVWTDAKGNDFDLANLQKKPYWQVTDDLTGMGMFNMIYIFNFCSFNGISCKGEQISAYEALQVMGEITDNCDIISRSTQPQIQHINNNVDSGLKITYDRGDECFNVYDAEVYSESPVQAQARKSTFIIECSTYDEDTWVVDTTNSCETQFKRKSNYACKGAGSGAYSNFKLLLWFFFFFTCYFVFGYVYNNKKQGKLGIEALPNSEFWQQFPLLFIEGIRYSANKIYLILKDVQDKIQNKEGRESIGYSTV